MGSLVLKREPREDAGMASTGDAQLLYDGNESEPATHQRNRYTARQPGSVIVGVYLSSLTWS